MAENIGKVISISGPAVDVQFEEARMPAIFQAIRIVGDGFVTPNPVNVIVEVQQHLGEGRVRCIAMVATEGMVRGMKAIDTGAGIRSEEHTSELQSHSDLVCRLLLEKKKIQRTTEVAPWPTAASPKRFFAGRWLTAVSSPLRYGAFGAPRAVMTATTIWYASVTAW